MRTAGLTFVSLICPFLFVIHATSQEFPVANPASTAPGTDLYALATPAPPEAPQPRRVVDMKFLAVMGALGAAESIRFTTRDLVLENEKAAGAPWVTNTPSHSSLVVKYAPIFGAELAVAYEMKKPHDWLPGDRIIRKLWWVYPVTMTAIHIKNSVGNIHTTGVGGCTSIQCAEAMQ